MSEKLDRLDESLQYQAEWALLFLKGTVAFW